MADKRITNGNPTATIYPEKLNFNQENGYMNVAYSANAMDFPQPYNSSNLHDEVIWTDLSLKNEPYYEKGNFDNIEPKMDHTDYGTTITLTPCSSLGGEDVIQKRPWYKYKPKWASIKTFTLIICILQGVNGLLVTGYTVAVLTTIEKQFHIDSTISGFVISSYEIGSLLSVVFVSYFGTHGHIPRWIGLGGLLLSVGSFLFGLPQFLTKYSPSNSNCTDNEQICLLSGEDSFQTTPAYISSTDSDSSGTNYVYVLIIAQILLGIGGSPMLTLGTVYIDNNAEKSDSALYIAFMYIMMAIGPVCGFLLGAWFLTYYVDPFDPLPTDVSCWVGMWWGGFAVCGILYILSSLPFLCFPRKVGKSNDISSVKQINYGRSWKKIPISIFRLATNSVYIVTTINYSIVMAIVSGFTTFLPKYIETQFNLDPSKASGLTGIVAVPGLCIGIYFGGWVIKRLKLEMKGVSILVLVVNIIAGTLLLLFFVFGCSNSPVAGLTAHYSSSDPHDLSPNNQCNAMCSNNCTVDDNSVHFVCNSNSSLSYISPCFAGCVTFDSVPTEGGTTKHYIGNCSCIDPDSISQMTDGLCTTDCHMLIPFVVLLFIICLAASNNQMPSILITLRSVAEEEKAFALGVQIVVLRLLCYLPSPIIYGHVIDSSCILWTDGTNNTDRTCALYDIKKFRLRFAGVSAILMVAGISCTIILCWRIRRRFSYSSPVTMNEIAQRVGGREDLRISWTTPDLSMRAWASDNDLSDKRAIRQIHQKTRSC